MKKVALVTGGAGFVGANLVHKLLNDNFEVHVLTRSSTNMWRLNDVKSAVAIHLDYLEDSNKLHELLKKKLVNFIYHLATYGAYPTQQDLTQMIQTNIVGTTNLLQAAKDIPYQGLVITGSSSEYGKKDYPMKEDDVLKPENFYAATKAAQTHLAQVFAKKFQKPISILRLFAVYGPLEESGRLVRNTIESAIDHAPIKLATGKEARDFIFVDDVCEAIIKAGEGNLAGEVINVGTGIQHTIFELAEMTKKLTNSKSKILLNAYPGRPTDTEFWVADMTKTKRILEWQAKTELADGLSQTIKWYKKHGK